MVCVQTEQLSIRYPTVETPTVQDITAFFRSGSRSLILGPSGVGKSTLILALNGIIPQSLDAEVSGEIAIGDVHPQHQTVGEMSRKVGILFQDPETQFCMYSVEEEVAFGLENLQVPREKMEPVIHDSLQNAGLLHVRQEPIHALSGGMKQKLALACLMAIDPEVLILDEPTANLDPQATIDVFALIDHWGKRANKTMIFIEHQLDDMIHFIDDVIILNKSGKVAYTGKPRALFQEHANRLFADGIWLPKTVRTAITLEDRIKWDPFPLVLTELEQQLKKEGIPQPAMPYPKAEEEPKSEKPIVEMQDVYYQYDHKSKSPFVLSGLTLHIHRGEFVALAGPNGAGKSTVAQLLLGVKKPSSGIIKWKDRPLASWPGDQFMSQIGLVMQNPESQFITERVDEEISFGPKRMGWSKDELQSHVDQLLETFDLAHVRAQNPFSLSQGQKRRLSVATMLFNHQELLILDEPTFGQDAANTEQLMKLLKSLQKQGKTILMITHDMGLADQYASRMIVLQEGGCAYEGAPVTFLHSLHYQPLRDQTNLTTPLDRKLYQWQHQVQQKVSVQYA
ncbi:ABC transporter ATP-binding protein [Natribacillus halophilus]|uniref:Energy-coupling factor transport system ATP-binding protein n=1 Tax=Natribacillus halophilus TaxID=549003 RepID=A0A1G8J554_9BACI|nr:ABC transporter ATP-binding protein [Natribacillus halophilus]SDI26398.1 energy-coupling factor transport system ATP-binding protein [Natribacillus halophilus]